MGVLRATKRGMTKYRKGPTKDHNGPTKDPQRSIENLCSLIASQYAEADRAICGRGNFILRLSHRSIGSPSLTGRRCQSRSGSASGTLCSRWHAKALLHGTQQSTSTDGSLTVLHRPESRCWEETGKSSSTKCRPHKTRSKNFD